jgi:hypothetical protein
LASLEVTPFNEAVWQAWMAKGRKQERRSAAACITVAKWALIPALAAAAGLWFHFAK